MKSNHKTNKKEWLLSEPLEYIDAIKKGDIDALVMTAESLSAWSKLLAEGLKEWEKKRNL